MSRTHRTDDVRELQEWLRSALRPGDHVVWSQGAATPTPLIDALGVVRDAASGGAVFMSVGVGPTIDPGAADHLRITGLGGLGSVRALADAGVLEVIPTHLSQVPELLACGVLRADVAFVQVSPDRGNGMHSLGLDAGYMLAAIEQARVVVAEVNGQVPFTDGHRLVATSRIDLLLHTDRTPSELVRPEPSAVERTIASLAVGFVAENAVLQFGIGSTPAAVIEPLLTARGLALHTGLMDDAQFALVESGAASGDQHPTTPGHAVTATLAGTRRLYEKAPAAGVLVREVQHTHGLAALAALPRFTAVNTAVEVDLTGQVNAEVAGNRVVGGLGGLGDFMRGAIVSPGGRSVVVLPSTAGSAAHPRIVPQLRSGSVTVPRSDVDVVATEYGAAELRGASLGQRARRLIDLAHPKDREALERWWASSSDARR